MKKSLKDKAQELEDQGKGFYSFEYNMFLREEADLKEKLLKFLSDHFTKNGSLMPTRYFNLVYHAIYSGKFSLSAFKKNMYSEQEIMSML